MASPSILGDLGHQLAVQPYSTSTALIHLRTSDTGVVSVTGRQVDLAKRYHLSATGGKPLDTTVHPRKNAAQQFRSVGIALGLETVFHASGLSLHVTATHQKRSATSGSGSTWATEKTETKRFKMGTDTDATFNDLGIVSTVNALGLQRYYRCNLALKFLKASDSSVADTSTGTEAMINSGLYLLGGADEYPTRR